MCAVLFCMTNKSDHANYCLKTIAILIARHWDNSTVENWRKKRKCTKQSRAPNFIVFVSFTYVVAFIIGLLFLESTVCENLVKRFSEKISRVVVVVKIMYIILIRIKNINVNKMRRLKQHHLKSIIMIRLENRRKINHHSRTTAEISFFSSVVLRKMLVFWEMISFCSNW